jgi:hypothetical protein
VERKSYLGIRRPEHPHLCLEIHTSKPSGEKETSSNAVAKSIRQEVRPLFHRLDSQKTSMGFSGSSLFNNTDELFTLSVPRSFDSLEHARRSLDLLVASSPDLFALSME